jgi:2-oxo-3-hexenedioate decarboxylase
MSLPEEETERLARLILSAADSASSIPPITDEFANFGLGDAYRVSSAVVRARIARGERPVGWKIGFTNRTIWDEYGVHAPIWGPMYDTTLAYADPAAGPVALPVGALVEPRIEPEIALRIGAAPHPDMDDAALMDCIDAVAHGVEIVQSVFPGWRFQAADTVAAFALHGAYRCGPLVSVEEAGRERWRAMLADFQMVLIRDGAEIDRGVAANVLGGGPLEALRHLVRGLADRPAGTDLKAGDIVTTGTVTRAFPVAAGETWSTAVRGLPLPGLQLRLT